MKKSHILALSLAAALALPALAQQQPSSNNPSDQNNQTQPAQNTQAQPSQSDQSTQTQPTQTATAPSQNSDQQAPGASGKEPLKYERHEGFWGHLNPFARKKYVARQLDPIRGRVNELDELTAKNAKQISDVDARATEGIRNAMSKANDADAHAVDAGNRADQANQTAQQAHTRIAGVEQTVSKLDQYQPVTQAEIRFRPGQTILSKNAKEALDEMASSLKSQRGYILEVQGFSPGAGVSAIENSREMAQMVVRYLVLNHEIPVYRIYTVGMGNAPLPSEDGKLRRARGGRVEVNLMKNSLGTMAAVQPNQAPSQSTNTGASADKPATPPQQ
jgi:outer membrane protein OmpA-like peptidoglycan-associated protein